MIELQPRGAARARASGASSAASCADAERVTVGTNLLEIDAWVAQLIADAGAVSSYVDYAPSFGSGPFGHVICTSVNDAVLHGLPHDYACATVTCSPSTSPRRSTASSPTRPSASSSVTRSTPRTSA